MLVNLEKSLKIFYYASCPFKVLGIREIIFSRDHPCLMKYTENWNCPFLSGDVTKAVSKASRMVGPPLESMHNAALALSKKKYDDLQQIKKFCLSTESQDFYRRLPCEGKEQDMDDYSEVSDEGESTDCNSERALYVLSKILKSNLLINILNFFLFDS
ncbi:hypothetical protein ElyMa_001584100 [Elysia marginata]|uniref:Uncharacterized protein n=1 Tax=Elysia marginata TaxID=1093978 RepID=A0AAV4JDW0_9GAST|nr:hypothetical protein ElyMa_001584100 [Elysia marginata]